MWAGEHERKRVIERVSRALNNRFRDGRVAGGAPYGWINVPVEGTKAKARRPHPEESLIIRRIFNLAAQGLGLHRIASLLNSENILAPRRIGEAGLAKYAETGEPVPARLLKREWTPSGVQEVLWREDARGVVLRGRRVNKKGKLGRKVKVYTPEDQWERVIDEGRRIVSDELWATAHAAIATNTAKTLRIGNLLVGKAENFKGRYLLSTLVNRSVCGRAMVVIQRGRNRQLAYVCATRRDNKGCTNTTGVPARELHRDVIAALHKNFNPMSFECHLQTTAADKDAAAARERERAHLTNTVLPALAQEELNFVTAIRSAKAGVIPALVEAHEDVQGRRREAEARLADLAQWQVDQVAPREQIARLRERWKDWEGALQGDGSKDLDLSRQLIKKLLASPVIVQPLGPSSWQWTAIGTGEALVGYVGKNKPAVSKPVDPKVVAETIRQTMLAQCAGLVPISGGSDAPLSAGGTESGSPSGPPT